jgi:hypothetical protein
VRLALLFLITSCMNLGPEVGPLQRTPCEDGDSDPDKSTTFDTDVRPLLAGAGHCIACHTPGGRSPFGLEISGLDISTKETLLAGGALSGTAIVVGGHPCDSILLQKLGTSPPFGARMPLDGPPYLDTAAMRTVADWIAEGAP